MSLTSISIDPFYKKSLRRQWVEACQLINGSDKSHLDDYYKAHRVLLEKMRDLILSPKMSDFKDLITPESSGGDSGLLQKSTRNRNEISKIFLSQYEYNPKLQEFLNITAEVDHKEFDVAIENMVKNSIFELSEIWLILYLSNQNNDLCNLISERIMSHLNVMKKDSEDVLDEFITSLSFRDSSILSMICLLNGADDEIGNKILNEIKGTTWLSNLLIILCPEIENFNLKSQISEFLTGYDSVDELSKFFTSYYLEAKIDSSPSSTQSYSDHMKRALKMAVEFGLSENVLKKLNLSAPIPQSLEDLHKSGTESLQQIIIGNQALGHHIANHIISFDKLSIDKKLEFYENIVRLILQSYGVHLIPEVSIEKLSITTAASYVTRTSSDSSYFYLGKIIVNEYWLNQHLLDSNPIAMISTIAHECCHYLEHLAQLLHNKAFLDHLETSPQSIDPETRQRLFGAGLMLSFNTRSLSAPKTLFSGGRHYGSSGEKNTNFYDYLKQLCERHAFKYQKIITKAILNGFDQEIVERLIWGSFCKNLINIRTNFFLHRENMGEEDLKNKLSDIALSLSKLLNDILNEKRLPKNYESTINEIINKMTAILDSETADDKTETMVNIVSLAKLSLDGAVTVLDYLKPAANEPPAERLVGMGQEQKIPGRAAAPCDLRSFG
ncbi:MAG: hypothetical protein JNK24_05575 [Alphaproteobacteria bacterium]|nr:hypothetical protein [Alphaproteobacteria bacterium]